MFKTLEKDKEVIERKYHNPDKEFDSFKRMEYHGYEYDENTGLSDEEMYHRLDMISVQLDEASHPLYKAHLFEFVLNNTRIDVNESDYFVGIYTWNRPISDYTANKWYKEVYEGFEQEKNIIERLEASGAVFGWLDFDHTVPDWDALLFLGFSGLLKRAEECFVNIPNPTQKQKDFYEGMKIEYTAVINLIDRMHRYALTQKHDKAQKVAKCLKSLKTGGAKNTYEALMLIYLYFMISESIDHYQVRSLGHGLDATLYPYFVKDTESGEYTKEEIFELIGYFLMQFSAIGNYWGQPFYLGGMNTDGTTKVNELSYAILDIYDRLGLYNPKIQIKIDKSTPRDFIMKALEMVRHGTNSIVFCNGDVITKCLMSRGATYEEAVDSVISGCYEYKVKAKGIGISVSYFNLLKPISFVFDNGFDTVSNKQVGIKTGELSSLTSFNEFYKAYLKQLEYAMTAYINALNTMETRVGEINPSLLYSGTIKECVTSMTDALDGGIENTTDYLISGLASAVDSLMAVYELVYEKKIVSLEEFKKALDNNWIGYKELHAKTLAARHKYGNGDMMADSYANAITSFVYNLYAGRKNSHGGGYTLEMHSARAFIIHGEKTKATPDGRCSGDETSKNASPVPGADRNGITALINSATRIDSVLCNSGFCLDVMLHPSAVVGEDGLIALYAVLDTYMKKGGASIHFNIFNADLLRDAQKNPDKYKNLQVRVCGWNVLWNNMDKKEQDAYILRAENIR